MILKRISRAALALACALAAACGDSPASPEANTPFSSTDLRVGAGVVAEPGSIIVVNYTGWLYDSRRTDQKGLQFDTSLGEGLVPLEFELGSGAVIRGWDLGLVGLKVGGLRKLVIPPSLAYGGSRQGPIPPNTSLVFEVELIEVKEASQ